VNKPLANIIIPERGSVVSAEALLAIEEQVTTAIAAIEDFGTLEEWRAQARALEQYLRDKDLQGPMLGSQRRIEGRIGQLLGEAPGRGKSEMSQRADLFHRQFREEFRILARALNGECLLENNEWRKSRRALVSLVRNRLGLVPELEPLPDGIFRCIVADPPWQLDTGPDAWGTKGESGHDNLAYEQMSVERIKQMPVVDHAADDAHLYLWTTNKYVEQSYDIARSWGFKPSVLLVWAKEPHGVGLGDAFRLTTEFILYARRGHLKEAQICDRTWFNWPRSIHSRKPEGFYELVETMTPAPYAEKDRLELFARGPRKGWTVWGDEAHG
jgi:N6-adenosine-specific RNA methylase IME4